MSNLRKETDNAYRIQGRARDNRFSLYLSNVTRKQANVIHHHVAELERAIATGTHPDVATVKWLESISDRLHERLVTAQLTEPRVSATNGIGAVVDAYIDARPDVKQSTKTNYKQTRRVLVNHFGEDRPVGSITEADAEAWQRGMGLAPATIAKHTKRARQFFAWAVRARLIETSPFAVLKAGQEVNRNRQHFVDAETTQAVIDALDSHLRTAFVLTRFAGMRCPSEVTRLTWADIDFDRGRIRIESPKTGLRFCPLFPEVRQELERTPRGSGKRVISFYGVDSNIATLIKRHMENAGIEVWPKFAINLRSTRRTELLREFSERAVSDWLGHSSAVAFRHYDQTTADDWERASGVLPGVASVETQSPASPETPDSASLLPLIIPDCGIQVTPTGLEPVLPP